jgi:hypothetical protein
MRQILDFGSMEYCVIARYLTAETPRGSGSGLGSFSDFGPTALIISEHKFSSLLALRRLT